MIDLQETGKHKVAWPLEHVPVEWEDFEMVVEHKLMSRDRHNRYTAVEFLEYLDHLKDNVPSLQGL